MTPLPRLLFYCQHSLGMGHLMRSRALARAFASRFDVTFVSGGAMPRGIRLPAPVHTVPLPPVGMNQAGQLVSQDRRRSLERAMAERRRRVLDTYSTVAPDVIVVELFPFGRRKFSTELEPMLDAARLSGPPPVVVCSLRDILVSKPADHDQRVAALLDRYFDAVLVHSDPAFARIEESFAARIPGKVPAIYTGFVHAGIAGDRRPALRPGSVVVSAGGGVVGGPLLRCALEAHRLLPPRSRRPMTLLAGPFLPDGEWQALAREAARCEDVELRRSVRDLALELSHAAASISQCGYNTAMDLLAARVPALVVPFGEGTEDEQLKRARRLESLGVVEVLLPQDLQPARLAERLDGLAGRRPGAVRLDVNGAVHATRQLEALLAHRAGSAVPFHHAHPEVTPHVLA